MIGIGKKNDRISFNKITALFLVKEIQSKKIILKNIPRCHFSALRFAEFPRSQGKRVRISKNFFMSYPVLPYFYSKYPSYFAFGALLGQK